MAIWRFLADLQSIQESSTFLTYTETEMVKSAHFYSNVFLEFFQKKACFAFISR
uniref:Uncharacterized protein n=1 Tax=Candidatus Kentrum sp. LPFa TaxID=2126335 RepID=A0A450W2Q7_9GAMM|nr:MAG: hypothetical protein BECKLPF1236B_GA0070989_102211 [Candidatus Kentron sp. LPFa]